MVKGYALALSTMRLFVSVDLDPLADAIRAAQEPFADVDGLRLTDPEGVHVTLKFLGEVSESRVPAVEDALAAAVEEAGVAPFEAHVGGYGVFPSRSYVSVVWLGVREGATDLTRLHEACEERTVALGFDPERHDFTPHATIARMDHAGGKERVLRVLDERDPDVGAMRIDEVRLTESTLTPDGPRYETVAAFPLSV